MSSNRTHNRAFEKAKQAFFEEGKRLDSEGSPAADCWICHKRIDYSVPPGTTDASHELDHYYPVRDYPDLQDDPAGFRHSHRKCNRERGAGQGCQAEGLCCAPRACQVAGLPIPGR